MTTALPPPLIEIVRADRSRPCPQARSNRHRSAHLPAMSVLQELLGGEWLYYDAIALIVEGETSTDAALPRLALRQVRRGLNSPLDRRATAPSARRSSPEVVLPISSRRFFEGCLPTKVARRGEETLRFGPLKPVGLRAPDGAGRGRSRSCGARTSLRASTTSSVSSRA